MNSYEVEVGRELDETAANLMKSHGVSRSQALRMAVHANPRLGSVYTNRPVANGFAEVYGPFLEKAHARDDGRMQLKVYSRSDADRTDNDVHVYERDIEDVVSEAKKVHAVDGNVSVPSAVLRILQTRPAVCRKIAGNWLDRQAKIEINNKNLGSSIDQAYPIALRGVMNEYPEVRQMYETGRVSELAMRTIFRQWYRD